MKKFTIHLLGLSHLPAARYLVSCAFTQKNIKLAKMLTSLGHTVYYYGARSEKENPIEEYIDSPNFHFVSTHTMADIRKSWGSGDNRYEMGYDYTGGEFRHDFNAPATECTQKFYAECIKRIKKKSKPDHFLFLSMGQWHTPVADAAGLFLRCESGIGYRGSSKANFRAFESSSLMHMTYGGEAAGACINGNNYDRVIPNFFDPADFEYNEAGPKDRLHRYYLYIGRMITRKGVFTALRACEALGAKLVFAGQGGRVEGKEFVSDEFRVTPTCPWTYVGVADIALRKDLFKGATATFVPTDYIEPFAGVHIESIISGTPVLTTDFGVFPGTVRNGVNGYRCHTLDDFVWAARECASWENPVAREYGERYLMDNVRWEYQEWLENLYQLYLSAVDKTLPGYNLIRTEQSEWRSKILS